MDYSGPVSRLFRYLHIQRVTAVNSRLVSFVRRFANLYFQLISVSWGYHYALFDGYFNTNGASAYYHANGRCRFVSRYFRSALFWCSSTGMGRRPRDSFTTELGLFYCRIRLRVFPIVSNSGRAKNVAMYFFVSFERVQGVLRASVRANFHGFLLA